MGNGIELGMEGRDRITRFQGVVMGICYYLSGCTQVLLTPRELTKEGKRPESEWFDLQRIEEVIGFDRLILDNSQIPGHDILPSRRT